MKKFIFSDVHGQKILFDQVVNFMEQEQDYICYYLGDACDRGSDGYSIMKYLLEHSDKFIYIKGNHEDLFVKAVRSFLADKPNLYHVQNWSDEHLEALMFDNNEIELYYMNGGLPTFIDWVRDGCPIDIIKALENLPTYVSFAVEDDSRVYDLCHAGCLVNSKDEEDKLWDRTHFMQKWYFQDDVPHILVHGHTPIVHLPHLVRKENHADVRRPLRYAEGTKIDMDTACFHYNTISVYEAESDTFHSFN